MDTTPTTDSTPAPTPDNAPDSLEQLAETADLTPEQAAQVQDWGDQRAADAVQASTAACQKCQGRGYTTELVAFQENVPHDIGIAGAVMNKTEEKIVFCDCPKGKELENSRRVLGNG